MRRFVAEPPRAHWAAPSSALCAACPPETSSTSSSPLAGDQTPRRASADTRVGAPSGRLASGWLTANSNRLAVLMWPVLITAVILVPLLVVAFVRVRRR